VYMPYFSFAAAFDTSQVRAVLANRGLYPPQVEDYFQNLIDYAIASDWGKYEPDRATVAGSPVRTE
jgi:hypothetical protein